ncbi:hypothetical protein [Microbacterium sp. NPDC057944]|uniref:hypothetical protein n=1 Tax=Microbacterium sp. NPDC057944 TaxID=3346286 RepID=UPI0036D9217D
MDRFWAAAFAPGWDRGGDGGSGCVELPLDEQGCGCVWQALRRAFAIAVLGLVAVSTFFVAISMTMDRSEPVQWGTFSEDRCEPKPRSSLCRSIGKWVSDTGDLAFESAVLDGKPGDDGTVDAYYRATDVFNANDPPVVRTAEADAENRWGSLLLFAISLACAVGIPVQLALWRRVSPTRRRR